jgi:hypothetical protein
MESFDTWTDQLLEVEQRFAEAHEILAQLQRDLKDAGRQSAGRMSYSTSVQLWRISSNSRP